MRKAAKQIGICALALILFCVLCRLTIFRTYTARIPVNAGREARLSDHGGPPRAEINDPEILELGEMDVHPDYINVPLHPKHQGAADIYLYDSQGEEIASRFFQVGPMGTVVDLHTGGFTGDTAVLIAVTLFWLLVSAIMLWHYFQAKGAAYYAYGTIYYAGFSLFAMLTGIMNLIITLQHLFQRDQFTMYSAYGAINGASMRFMMITLPLMILFAIALIVSNIALLRHEKMRKNNILGFTVGLLLILGEALGYYLFARDFVGSEWEYRVQETLQNVYATLFIYFECMLIGSVICGVRSARHQPALDKDFIIILGCWFRRDGTLPPLLQGRVEKALAFWRLQKEKTGKEALLIPSGGQGKDEPMPEAEAMRRYLISQGVSRDRILPESRSMNTYQNMVFSKEIIEGIHPEGKAAFATTSYHVFRSGVWANLAGLSAEGMGGKTRWWFWPNAFMRECLGLLKNRWKQEILLMIALMAFFGVLSMVLG